MTESNQELPLKTKINLETAIVHWKELELFFAKGSLICVTNNCDLVTVASQIASNQKEEIETLILDRSIQFVTPEWAKKYCLDNPKLWAVVVAPYVLCQLVQS
ncbi:DUF2288 family protein [Aliikangiella sp. IMCC44359]|uniref:DUF2288 family protein n=1 Tax=Aliikangiella sp. IMCC44359 TaxID=3459125 RepID=UPI00403AA6D6